MSPDRGIPGDNTGIEKDMGGRCHWTRYTEKWMKGMAQSNLTTTKKAKNENIPQSDSFKLPCRCWMSNI